MVADNFFLDAFIWEKRSNELISLVEHWRRNEIPPMITIYGKYMTVRYQFIGFAIGLNMAKFSPFLDDQDCSARKLPDVFVKYMP